MNEWIDVFECMYRKFALIITILVGDINKEIVKPDQNVYLLRFS